MISIELRIVTIAVSVAFLIFVLLMVRRERFLLRYSLIWIVLSALGIVAALFPDLVYAVSDLLGFQEPSNFLYFCAIVFLMIFSLTLCGVVSRQSVEIKRLVQHLSIVDSEKQKRCISSSEDNKANSSVDGQEG